MEGGNRKTKKFGVTKELVAISNRMDRVGFIEKVTFEPSPKGDEGGSLTVCGGSHSKYREQLLQSLSGMFKKQGGQNGWTRMSKEDVVMKRSQRLGKSIPEQVISCYQTKALYGLAQTWIFKPVNGKRDQNIMIPL